jgi:hypothetical protein
MSELFTVQRVTEYITQESSERGDYDRVDEGAVEATDFRGALEALRSDCWDTIDQSGDTLICYPADAHQDMRTGEYDLTQVIVKARHASWIDRLMRAYEGGAR